MKPPPMHPSFLGQNPIYNPGEYPTKNEDDVNGTVVFRPCDPVLKNAEDIVIFLASTCLGLTISFIYRSCRISEVFF